MEHLKTVRNLIPGTLASLATLPRTLAAPPKSSGNDKPRQKPINPCKTDWQAKWLGLDVTHPSIQTLASAAEKFCGQWFKNDNSKPLLVLVGDFGTGKTHVAKRIFNFCNAASSAAFEKGCWGKSNFPSSTFIHWPEASSAFQEKEFGIMEDAFNADLVVIDDVGSENDPWKVCADKFCQILSRREKKFTVVTTNVTPEQWTERFDGRINDRLMRSSVVNQLSAESYSLR